ncbi:MAG: response regulator [Candidatus Omnitrophota bacterium]
MKNILIVDDEPDIRNILKKKLLQEEYNVTAISSSEEALDICKNNPPNLILLDVALPMLNGYELCEKIKQNPATKDIAVLFMTGKELEPQSIIKRCKELGACGYILKPCSSEELLEKIKEVLG